VREEGHLETHIYPSNKEKRASFDGSKFRKIQKKGEPDGLKGGTKGKRGGGHKEVSFFSTIASTTKTPREERFES